MISTLVGDPVLCMVGVSAGTAAGPRNASSSSTPIVPPASRSIARNSFLPEQERCGARTRIRGRKQHAERWHHADRPELSVAHVVLVDPALLPDRRLELLEVQRAGVVPETQAPQPRRKSCRHRRNKRADMAGRRETGAEAAHLSSSSKTRFGSEPTPPVPPPNASVLNCRRSCLTSARSTPALAATAAAAEAALAWAACRCSLSAVLAASVACLPNQQHKQG